MALFLFKKLVLTFFLEEYIARQFTDSKLGFLQVSIWKNQFSSKIVIITRC